jgi:hypothetical protein
MFVNWDEIEKALSPIKGYQDLCHRLTQSFSYAFVRYSFNFSMPELVIYTEKLLGGDARGRYSVYLTKLVGIITNLDHAGVPNVLALKERVSSHDQFETFTSTSGINPLDTISVLKYLVYWLIPGEKYLSGLVRDDPEISEAIKVLRSAGIRTNLGMLKAGITTHGRKELAHTSGLPVEIITELVNRADFSRMPWASKATISNIIGAGYGSLAELANADPDKLYADFFRYGKSIGKNLKFGNEIENSYRIAKIVPVLVQADTPRN